MATDLARFIGGPGDGMSFRVDTWPPPSTFVYGGAPDVENTEPSPALYELQGTGSTLADTFAGGDILVRVAAYVHGGDWTPPG